ncbi:hypothetical protein FRC09_008250 [Ceratobasidium sp. 395]|nr:hypothetical protein FRC09_008250 [Ceratobasidium sp. 395]
MVQWGGFEDERNEEIHAHKERHVVYWEEHGNPELELWRFETGFAHGWGAGNNEEHGELAEQRLAEHVAEVRHGEGHVWDRSSWVFAILSMAETVKVDMRGNTSTAIA